MSSEYVLDFGINTSEKETDNLNGITIRTPDTINQENFNSTEQYLVQCKHRPDKVIASDNNDRLDYLIVSQHFVS